jgi:cytochrome c biogenesis protein CcdA
MKKLLFIVLFLFMLVGAQASSDIVLPETNIHYFYSTTCSHCENVADSGILAEVASWQGVNLEKYEISLLETSRETYLDFADKFKIDPNKRGIPFLVIERGEKYSYLMGDGPIINDLGETLKNFQGSEFDGDVDYPFIGRLTLGVVIVAALIDSINPCAFGVLLFLMAVLLSMGSSKRALRSGMIYTFVIFLVYLLAGIGIMKLIGSFSILNYVSLVAGGIVLIGGIIELKDFFWEGKGISLRIPEGTKPLLEKYVRKGTLPAIIILGILVALVELPCTGGIYLAILSLISGGGTNGMYYLVLYNLIFVLPLILISYLIYRGTRVNSINGWVQKNKRFMRLAAGLIMIFLAFNLLNIL